MAISDADEIMRLTAADIADGLLLSGEAGWNQTAEDWRVFIENGETLGIREPGGRVIATGAALPYRGPMAYIGMVLVTPAWRRRGLATRLVDACIERIERLGLVPMLDATPAGEAVYVRQGFRALFRMDRWQREAGPGERAAFAGDHAGPADLPAIVRLDTEAFGAERADLFASFLARQGTRAILGADGTGFAMIRDGSRARQLGPVVAQSEQEAIGLIGRLLGDEAGRVFIDVPSRWQTLTEWLSTRGFTIQRGYARMAKGATEPFGSTGMLFSLAGPEFG